MYQWKAHQWNQNLFGGFEKSCHLKEFKGEMKAAKNNLTWTVREILVFTYCERGHDDKINISSIFFTLFYLPSHCH